MDNIDSDSYKPIVFSESIQCDVKEEQDLIHLTDTKPNDNKIMRELMEKMSQMLENNIGDTNVKDTFNAMVNAFDNYESIDKDMVERLNNIFSNDLVKKEQFVSIVKAIRQGSTVVYFKSAQLFKVYKKTELETLLGGQIRTIYKQLNESYEVIPNDSKQKIIILGDISLADSIERIKTYIVSFMISEGITTFTDNDIVCYKSKESIEIIINDYYVENQTEHDEIVKKLLNYILQQEKNTKIVQKINTLSYSEFEGVKMVSMPSEKQLLATEYIEPLLTMISNVTQCSGFKNQINLSVTIHDHSINTINDNSINTTNINENPKTIKTFCKYLFDERPEWYIENTYVPIEIIEQKYRAYFNDNYYSRANISRLLKGKLFTSSTRIKSVTHKKLFSFRDLNNHI